MSKADWKTWVQWYEVTGGQRGTIEEFRELLKKYNRSSLLIMCAQVSVAFAFGPEAETTASVELTKLWTRILFTSEVVPKIQQFCKNGRLVFFQGQLRFIAAEILRLGPETDTSLPPIENHALGEVLLRASELMYFKHDDHAFGVKRTVQFLFFLPFLLPVTKPLLSGSPFDSLAPSDHCPFHGSGFFPNLAKFRLGSRLVAPADGLRHGGRLAYLKDGLM